MTAERIAAPFPTVQGRCPACGWATLFLGSGGYVTCARLECPQPDAASTLLERDPRRTAARRWAETIDSTDGGQTIRIPAYAPDGSETDGITVDRINAAVLRDMLTDFLGQEPTQ